MDPPEVPRPARGKLFLRKFLDSVGLEMSLNAVPPGKAIPFLHRHRENVEVYVVVGGRGQFLVDGECIDVSEGSVLRLGPAAARAWQTTPTPRCTSCASSTGRTAWFREARRTARRSRTRPPGRTESARDCPPTTTEERQ